MEGGCLDQGNPQEQSREGVEHSLGEELKAAYPDLGREGKATEQGLGQGGAALPGLSGRALTGGSRPVGNAPL